MRFAIILSTVCTFHSIVAMPQLGSAPQPAEGDKAAQQEGGAVLLKPSPTAAEGADVTPELVAEYLEKFCFGPTHLLEREGEQTFATVPVRVVILEGPKLEVEFERRAVVEPLTTEQLPASVAVVSRFKDGTELPGAFMRNPTNEKIVHLYTTRVAHITFWEGHGYYVSTVRFGRPFVCHSGGVAMRVVDDSGNVKFVEQPSPPPEPRYESGYREPVAMPGTLDVPVFYCENAPLVSTLTPTFVFPDPPAGREMYVYVQSIGWMDWCQGDRLPLATRSVKVPAGLLEPGRSYDLIVAVDGALGRVVTNSYRFRIAEKDALRDDASEVRFLVSQGRTEP